MERLFGPRTKYSIMSEEEKSRYLADFRQKYSDMRALYPHYEIPPFDDNTNLDILHTQYEVYMKRDLINNGAKSYQNWLVVSWLCMELGGTSIGLKISGYTMKQIRDLNKYRSVLDKIKEQNLVAVGSEWPPLVQLLMWSLLSAGSLIVMNFLVSYFGDSIRSILETALNGIMGGAASAAINTNNVANNQGPAQGQQNAQGPAPNAVQNSGIAGILSGLGNLNIGGILGNLLPMFNQGQDTAENTGNARQSSSRIRPEYNE